MLDELFWDGYEWKCSVNDPINGPDHDGIRAVLADDIDEDALDKRCCYECESEDREDEEGEPYRLILKVGEVISSPD